ncbi:hypothetical protein PENTCL1PPCAC_12653, partial [Pristionchus entomophagus]
CRMERAESHEYLTLPSFFIDSSFLPLLLTLASPSLFIVQLGLPDCPSQRLQPALTVWPVPFVMLMSPVYGYGRSTKDGRID